jgi:hypothetical protein
MNQVQLPPAAEFHSTNPLCVPLYARLVRIGSLPPLGEDTVVNTLGDATDGTEAS